MPELKVELKFNLVGSMLGKSCISIQKDSLISLNKDTSFESHLILDSAEFAIFKKGFWGYTLIINTGTSTLKYRFLKNNGSDIFLETLNTIIAEHMSERLDRIFTEFNTYVIREYPRDSRIDLIFNLCKTLSSRYSSQADLWDTLLKPNYISKIKEIISFHPVTSEFLRQHHEKIQLENRAAFFDLVESNPLTHEQRLGVLRSNDKNMVLAAAGTGKTSVMVAKALDLIERQLAKPSEILVLAYNRAAAEELKERLSDKANKSNITLESLPQISTFHALGRKLLRDSGIPTHMSAFTEDEIKFKQWVTSWLETYGGGEN